MDKMRPNPDQLLQRAELEEQQSKQGKLKIYLGAAPGVGKTYEMLHDALLKREQGLDVIIGIVETHGRKEIEKLTRHFDTLPRQLLEHRGKTFSEFDLDAALQRNPGLILVDEMAHSNPEGLRHAKRWQDIKELLDKGIDVYTTLNVQHIESIKDDIAQIVHARIQETVPDSMIERANTIELIDLPPEDLLKRLQEGKVYIPQQAELAMEHFFLKGNLIALRELALRVTAERVGSEVLLYRQDVGIKEIWPTKDKILVCVGPRPEALKLIRQAKRFAASLQARWLAVYIDTPNATPKQRNEAIKHLRLADLLGAETHVISGFDIVREIMGFARANNITQIMLWKQVLPRWQHWFRKTLVDEILRNSEEINVYVVPGYGKNHEPEEPSSGKKWDWKGYGLALSVVALASLLNALIAPMFAAGNLIMVYLLSVVVVALAGKRGPAVFASFLSVIAYDFLFVPPYFSFLVANKEYLLTLAVMLLVSQLMSYLTILISRKAEAARLAQHQTTAIYTLSRNLTRTRGKENLLALGVEHIAQVFDSEVIGLLPKNHQLQIAASYPLQPHLSDKEYSIAQWVFDLGQAAGLGTDTLSSSQAVFLPLTGSSKVLGVVRIQRHSEALFTPDQRALLESCVNQVAMAIEVDGLHERNRKKQMEKEKDEAQGIVLIGIFNDLSLPLKKLLQAVKRMQKSQASGQNPKTTALEPEIRNLSRLNKNLYHIIQLDTQAIQLHKVPASLKKIIQSVLKLALKELENRPVKVSVPEDLPLVWLDIKLIQEVFLHLIDNAIKFSPPKSGIQIEVDNNNSLVNVRIIDSGSGLSKQEISKVFKKFYKGKAAIKSPGLGLGLSICEKIIQAHQGSIGAENFNHMGAVFYFSLPLGSVDE